MPKQGWKNVTVAEEVYDYFMDEWIKHRDEYRLKYGITSFAGFITKLLTEAIENRRAKESAGKSRRSRSGTPPS